MKILDGMGKSLIFFYSVAPYHAVLRTNCLNSIPCSGGVVTGKPGVFIPTHRFKMFISCTVKEKGKYRMFVPVPGNSVSG